MYFVFLRFYKNEINITNNKKKSLALLMKVLLVKNKACNPEAVVHRCSSK